MCKFIVGLFPCVTILSGSYVNTVRRIRSLLVGAMKILVSRIGVGTAAWRLGGGQKALSCNNLACYIALQKASVLDWFFGILKVDPAWPSIQGTGCTNVCASAKLRKAAFSFIVSVCPSAWKSSTATGRISLKFYSCMFFENLARKFKIS